MRLASSSFLLVLGLVASTQEARAQEIGTPGTGAAPEKAASEKAASFYAFEGFTFSKVRGGLAAHSSSFIQIQVGVGFQPKNSLWAYELMGRGGPSLDLQGPGSSLLGWGLRAKRFVPVHPNFQLYGRAGLTENLLTDTVGSDLVGFGLEYGAGAQASLRVRALGLLFWPAFFLGVGPKVDLSLWADLGGEVGNLHAGHDSSSESVNYRTASASYGLSVGGNF